MMRILYIVDGRSPIAINWIKYFIHQGHEVHLVSLFPCQLDFPIASLTVLPLRFSGAGGEISAANGLKTRILRTLAPPRFRTWFRHTFVPGSISKSAIVLRSLISRIEPDIVHAMRIPYEGMLTSLAIGFEDTNFPFLVSVWGNDFTLHAPATRNLSHLTKQTLERIDGLHTDCHRDRILAEAWGFNPEHQAAVILPGAGGIQLDTFFPSDIETKPWVINPRGMRAYVRNDTFFKSIPQVLEGFPEVRFLCPNMQNQPAAEQWVEQLGIGESVILLPFQSREAMADLYRQSAIIVSPSIHDGTPNTLLEGMACGCFPVAGDIETIREWVIPGVNGLVFDPADEKSLAESICLALENRLRREYAQKHNRSLIQEKADYGKVMVKAADFYRQMIAMKLEQKSSC